MVKNKIISSTLAAVLAISSVVPLAVEATGVQGTNSSFDYDLTVTPVSDSQIKVTFFTTHNPGVNDLTLAFSYDSDKYDAVNIRPEYNAADMAGSGIRKISAFNQKKGIAIWNMQFLYQEDNVYKYIDYTNDFDICLYLEAKDGNITDEDLSKFTVGVIEYNSKSENINFSVPNIEYISDENLEKIEITPSQNINYEYILGDADGSGRINVGDATNIGSLVSVANAANLSPTVNILNSKIANNETSVLNGGNTVVWGNRFSSFLRNVDNVIFPCVEAADANQDGIITTDDSQLVLDWYAQIAASVISADDLLTVKHKTVYF